MPPYSIEKLKVLLQFKYLMVVSFGENMDTIIIAVEEVLTTRKRKQLTIITMGHGLVLANFEMLLALSVHPNFHPTIPSQIYNNDNGLCNPGCKVDSILSG